MMSNLNPKSYKLLIVDDVSQNIQVLGSILRDHGYAISFAMDGKRALELTAKEKFDLILLDIMMPELSGYDVCTTLKQDPLTRDIPVIFLTAKTEVDNIVKGFRTGAVDYITKPFYSEELLSRVQTHLELKNTREQLAQSNAAKDMFFSIIAHDLKNPFQSLLGFSELLIDNFDNMGKNKIIKYIQTINNSGKNFYKLLENLLHWSSLQTGRIDCNRENINLLSVLEKCLETLHSNYTIKNIHIINTIDPSIQVYADPDMTELILRNLISNAIKYTSDSGEVRIDSKLIQNFVEIAVSDHGMGIEDQDIPKLFKIEEKYSAPGTCNERGTGLGLILCKDFIELNNGEIWVESEIGRGSVFTVTLPGQNI